MFPLPQPNSYSLLQEDSNPTEGPLGFLRRAGVFQCGMKFPLQLDLAGTICPTEFNGIIQVGKAIHV